MSEPYLGEIRMFGGNFAPRGWVFCDGRQLAISQYSALFSLLGTIYGGNGQTTFAVPDLRGRSPVGMGQGPGLANIVEGQASGTESVSLHSINMPPMMAAVTGTTSIAVPVNTTPGSTKTPSNATVLSATNDTAAGAEVDIYSDGPGTTTLAPFGASVTGQAAFSGGNQPLGIRNPYLGVNFIIAVQGIFPSRN